VRFAVIVGQRWVDDGVPLAELDTTMISPKAQFQLNEEQRKKLLVQKVD
jgi:hypothetical protein